MKKFFFVVSLLLIFMPISVFAGWQDPIHSGDFVTTWKTDDGKVSLGFNLEGTTMYDVSWNCDGNYEQGIWDLKITHDYTVSGTYDICLKSSGKLQFNPSRLTTDEKVKLQEIKQWWNIKWSSFNSAFNGMINVQLTAIDAPDLSAVTDMSSAFHGANKLTGCDSMNTWNTINVTNMTSMFENAGKFNAPIGNWNTSNVKDMSRMFRNAQSFNQPIGNWNTSKCGKVIFNFFKEQI